MQLEKNLRKCAQTLFCEIMSNIDYLKCDDERNEISYENFNEMFIEAVAVAYLNVVNTLSSTDTVLADSCEKALIILEKVNKKLLKKSKVKGEKKCVKKKK